MTCGLGCDEAPGGEVGYEGGEVEIYGAPGCQGTGRRKGEGHGQVEQRWAFPIGV